jgi:CRISPR-associated endonuclease/helicase Cas3
MPADLSRSSQLYTTSVRLVQDKYAPTTLRQDLANANLRLRGYSLRTMQAYHGVVTTWALDAEGLLATGLGMQPRLASKIARAVGGHHGVWPGAGTWADLDDDVEWASVRADLFWELKALLAPPSVTVAPGTFALNGLLVWLSGFTSVADWVGSIEEYFPLEHGYLHARRYAERAWQQAKNALQKLGWLGWKSQGEQLPFQEMFPFWPRPLQQAVIEAGSTARQPALLILEAPTGIGKTETAFYLADTWLQSGGGRGLYVAMPTQATSNQMFGRTLRFLANRYPDELVNLHLVHGQAAWSDAVQEITLHTVGEDDEARVAAMSWFDRQRKRTLLAPFGVGTVDQTLLSILQTKHFFVRLFGLGHKVVIFDEVHAYDTYMNELFYRLLAWLRALNVSVIILSATLPAATRRNLIEAYTGQPVPAQDTPSSYPAVTAVDADNQPRTISLPAPPSISLGLVWCDRDEVVVLLGQELAEGGCAVVVCNTVRRAQELHQSLAEAQLVSSDNLILFHARFPPVWRQEIESSVLAQFGPPDPSLPDQIRPYRAIVVATQVVEQSLDLDFDVMISDHAPIDLLLQRAGRLQRHDRGPRRHARRLILIRPEIEEILPRFTPADVYEPHVLLRSYAALDGRKHITLPEETPTLIEAVYGPLETATARDPSWQEALAGSYTTMMHQQRETAGRAAQTLVREPGNARLLNQSIAGLEEDNPTIHAVFRAQTRDIDLGVTLVCLHRHGDRITLDPDPGSVSVDLDAVPDRDLVRALLQRTITVHHWGVVRYFLSVSTSGGWAKHGALAYMHAAVFEDGVCRLPGTRYFMTLSRELGLGVHKEVA